MSDWVVVQMACFEKNKSSKVSFFGWQNRLYSFEKAGMGLEMSNLNEKGFEKGKVMMRKKGFDKKGFEE